MKKTCFCILFMLLMIFGCTQNNGHIGPIFGSWTLVEISDNGSPIDLDDSETVFSFQNQIVEVAHLTEPPYSTAYKYGNFTLSDNILTLKFSAEPTIDGSHQFMTPTWLHFPEDGNPIRFEVRKLDGKEMILDMKADKNYTYYFKKTW